jgi:hypothetical protein
MGSDSTVGRHRNLKSSDILFCRFVARILGRTADTLTTARERPSSSSMKEGIL